MSPAHLKAIAIGVVVLLLAWGASELFSRRPDTTTAAFSLSAPAAAQVDTIEITHAADTIVLAKGATAAWTVNGLVAAGPKVAELLAALHDSARPELAAQDPSSFGRMGVDSASGRMLRIAGGGKTQLRVIIGGHGPGYDASYLRLPGDAHVYLWHGGLPGLAERSLDDWRDREIAAVPSESVAAVDVRRGREHYVLTKRGTTWSLPSGAPTDSSAVARLLQSFRTLTASGFASQRQADSLRLKRPQRSVTLRASAGTELVALTLDSTAGAFWVRRADRPTVYRLDFWQVDQITPSAATLARAKR